MLGTHGVFLDAQMAFQVIKNLGRLPLLRSHFVRAQITFESPAGPLGDGGNDPEQVGSAVCGARFISFAMAE